MLTQHVGTDISASDFGINTSKSKLKVMVEYNNYAGNNTVNTETVASPGLGARGAQNA